jgi:hypothetical protein
MAIPMHKQIIILCLLYIIGYIYAIHYGILVTKLADTNPVAAKIEAIHTSSWGGQNFLTGGRGANYIIGKPPTGGVDGGSQAITFWGMSHFALYALIGAMCPGMFWPSLFVGIGFEAYECKKYNCEDLLDIALNTSGFLAGMGIRQVFAM